MYAMIAETAILVFARSPVAGRAKTRLIPLLGARGAARAQAQLLRHSLATAAAAGPGSLQLWCTPDTTHPELHSAATAHGATLHAQQGVDLGARMNHAFSAALADSPQVILIGTDCPALSAAHLQDASARLARGCDAVLVPAEDGGYALIGLRRAAPALFSNVDWGTDRVLDQTRQRLRLGGLHWHELETLWDIDRPADWLRLQHSGLLA
jgi:rSAM/selenodomain-associated transferase 1